MTPRYSSWETRSGRKRTSSDGQSQSTALTGRSLSARLQGSLRFSPISVTRIANRAILAMDFPLARSATGLPCSAEMMRSVRSALYAGMLITMTEKSGRPRSPAENEAPDFLCHGVITLRVESRSKPDRIISAEQGKPVALLARGKSIGKIARWRCGNGGRKRRLPCIGQIDCGPVKLLIVIVIGRSSLPSGPRLH